MILNDFNNNTSKGYKLPYCDRFISQRAPDNELFNDFDTKAEIFAPNIT